MTEHRRTRVNDKIGVFLCGFVPLACLTGLGCQTPWLGSQARKEQAAIDLLQSAASPLNKPQGDRSASDRHGSSSAAIQESLSQPSVSSRRSSREKIADSEPADEDTQEFSVDDLDPKAKQALQSQWKAATGKDLEFELDREQPRAMKLPVTPRQHSGQQADQPSRSEEEPVSLSFSDQDESPAESQSTPVQRTHAKVSETGAIPEKIKSSEISNWKYGTSNNKSQHRPYNPEQSSRQKVPAENSGRLSDTVYREPTVKTTSAERSVNSTRSELEPSQAGMEPSETAHDTDEPATPLEGDSSAFLQESLKAISVQLEENQSLNRDQRLRMEIQQRLHHLMLGDLNAAMESIDSLQSHEQDFFKHLFQTLHDISDPAGNPVRSRRNTLALASLRKSLAHLAAASNLEVHNATFCSKVDGFGVLEKFPQYHFRPEQEVLLYCELDNFVSDQVTDGYETKLQGSYEIVNSDGRRVADQTLSIDASVCRNQRRDYFIAYRLYMPREIDQGKHSLKLTIEDIKGQKFGQATLDFHIVK